MQFEGVDVSRKLLINACLCKELKLLLGFESLPVRQLLFAALGAHEIAENCGAEARRNAFRKLFPSI